jgi:hypothetical protein
MSSRVTCCCLSGCVMVINLAVAVAAADASGERFYYAPPRSSYDVHLLEQPPTLDGDAGDPGWRGVAPSDGLVDIETAATAHKQTFFRLGYAADAIYVVVTCIEPDMDRIKVGDRGSDGWGFHAEDSIDIFFTPAGAPDFYHFSANALGQRWGVVFSPDLTAVAKIGAEAWEVAVTRGTDVWQLEARIPFASLQRSLPREGEAWRFNLVRNIHSDTTRAVEGQRRIATWSRELAGVAHGIHAPGLFGQIVFHQTVTPADHYREALAGRRAALTTAPAGLQRDFPGKRTPLPAAAASWQRLLDGALEVYCSTALRDLQHLDEQWAADPEAALQTAVRRDLATQLRGLRYGLANYDRLPGYVRSWGDRPYLVYVVPPTSNDKVLPGAFPVPGTLGTELRVSACPDEYAPASFALYAAEDLRDVTVTASALSTAFGWIGRQRPAPEVDLFAVKTWWKPRVVGDAYDPTQDPVLTPELLLKDPGLVVVDQGLKRNSVRDPQGPRDAKALQPVTVRRQDIQQYWVNVHVPAGTRPGIYKGHLDVQAHGAPGLRLALTVEVLPFNLDPPVLEYGIYYPAQLARADAETPSAAGLTGSKTEAQYLADMIDLKAHGVELPDCADDTPVTALGALDFSHMRRVWELRQKAGLTKGPVVKIRSGVPVSDLAATRDPARQREILKAVRERTAQWLAFCRETGFPPILIYGIDEAGGERLQAQQPGYKAVQEAGGMTAAAVSSPFLPYSGDALNRPIIFKGGPPCDLQAIHAQGNKAWMYAGPQAGLEEPETYRRNYGIALWQRGLDGAATWAYQHGGPSLNMWNESATVRLYNMTYPGLDAPISTLQWEGWRQAVNDVRYLSTLLRLIETAKTRDETRSLGVDCEQWLQHLDTRGDLDAIRRQMVERILRLRDAGLR